MEELKVLLTEILSRLSSIDEKQAETSNKQALMNEVQVRHEENLQEHMRRTALLEKEFKPVHKHVHQVRGAIIFLAAATPIAVAIWIALQ
jgi:hypothetical protein